MKPTNKNEVHFMLDLETLGTTPGSVILSIGCVVVIYCKKAEQWVVYPLPEDQFTRVINIQDSLDAGCTVDGSTIKWWLQQSDEARYELVHAETSNLCPVLECFMAFCHMKCEEKKHRMLWGNGASFDNAILMKAYRMLGYTDEQLPFFFYNDRCFRTLKNVFSHVPKPEFEGTKHNALADARHQAQHLASILNHIDTLAAQPDHSTYHLASVLNHIDTLAAQPDHSA